MVLNQDIQLIPRFGGLKLTLLPVLVEFGAIVSLSLDIRQHNDPIVRWSTALPQVLVLLAAALNAVERSLARLWIYLAWTHTFRN